MYSCGLLSRGRAKTGRRARTYIQQLCADTGCIPEDQWTIEKGGEKRSGISVLMARHDTYIYIYIYIYIYKHIACIPSIIQNF